MNISNRALADAMSLFGCDGPEAEVRIRDALRKAVRTSATGYSYDCWLLTVKDGVVQRVRQHRVKVGDIYVSPHAIKRAHQRFRVPKEEAAQWLVNLYRRASFLSVMRDEKGNLGRNFYVDGVLIGLDMREPVIKTVFPVSIASRKLYRKMERLARRELRKAELKLRIARAFRLPAGRIEGMIREYKHVARSLPVHAAAVIREA